MSAAEDRRDGARQALQALHNVPKLLLQDEDSTAEWFSRRDMAIAAIMAAAGPLPPRAEGAMRLLAEYHVIGEQNGGTYGLDDWEPEVTMTPKRQQETRDEFAAYIDQCKAEECARLGGKHGNVIYLGAR